MSLCVHIHLYHGVWNWEHIRVVYFYFSHVSTRDETQGVVCMWPHWHIFGFKNSSCMCWCLSVHMHQAKHRNNRNICRSNMGLPEIEHKSWGLLPASNFTYWDIIWCSFVVLRKGCEQVVSPQKKPTWPKR